MAVQRFWARVFFDTERCLVYSPRFGRFYLIAAERVFDRQLQAILGLSAMVFRDELADPVQRIVHDLPNLKTMPVVTVSGWLRIAYHLLHFSRNVVPFGTMVALVRMAAALVRDRKWPHILRPYLTASDIGRIVHGVECAAELANCYPRALLTCFLCLSNGLPCDLTIGTLAPTRKMHAWCGTDGQLPYEALPEHYMYRPLFVMTLAP